MSGIGSRYLLDTNIFIYYFNGDPAVQPLFTEILTDNVNVFYCPISWAELLCYPALTEPEANQIRDFLRSLTIVTLTERVLDRAAQIRRDYRLALPDALIATCSTEVNSILVTRNMQDFQRITDLTLMNPFAP